jgi:hypothetical protein
MRTSRTYLLRIIPASVVIAIVLASTARSSEHQQSPPRKPAGPTLRIVNDKLIKVDYGDCPGCMYAVKGSIYNPNNDGVKNVVIKYYIWKKWMGKDGHGSAIKETGGLVSATIKYLPPKKTVEFTATSRNAPVMSADTGLVPDPINAEITADWDTQ